MKTILSTLLSFFLVLFVTAQSYTSYLTGSSEDLDVQPEFGICLMGGGIESDPAMTWFLEKANGGDVVVIRTSGSNGYNNYMFSQLGVSLNSVETILFNSAAAANDSYVIDRLNGAEAIWLAGGDQSEYIDFWRETPIEEAINNLINVRGGAIGGTSAGMAVMAQGYFSAQNGSIDSDEAIANPFDNRLVLGWNDFIHTPFLENAITDTHFNARDRYGRLMTFMGRLIHDHDLEYVRGIASNEHVAVVIGSDGLAHAYGEYPVYDDEFAYFLQSNCEVNQTPEIIEANMPLTWNRSFKAVKSYKVPATMSGENYFDLNDWVSGQGGEWQNWYVTDTELSISDDELAPDCIVNISKMENDLFKLYPNPTSEKLRVQFSQSYSGKWQVTDVSGRVILTGNTRQSNLELIDVSSLKSGVYTITFTSVNATVSTQFLKTR